MADHTSITDITSQPIQETPEHTDPSAAVETPPNQSPSETRTPATNRRRLLLGAGTTALAASAALITPAITPAMATSATAQADGASVPIAVADDPACRALEVTQVAQAAADAHRGPEEDYDRVFDAYIAAERALIATPSGSLMGLYGKVRWLAEDLGWSEDADFIEDALGFSIVKDLARMTGQTLEGQTLRRRGRS